MHEHCTTKMRKCWCMKFLCIISGCPAGARKWHISCFAMLLHSKSVFRKKDHCMYRKFGKRILGIILSGCGIVTLSPICLLVALAIVLDDPGPVFSGKNEWAFTRPTFRFSNSALCGCVPPRYPHPPFGKPPAVYYPGRPHFAQDLPGRTASDFPDFYRENGGDWTPARTVESV